MAMDRKLNLQTGESLILFMIAAVVLAVLFLDIGQGSSI